MIFRLDILSYIANADIGIFSIHYLISIGTHAGEIWRRSYGLNYTKFWASWPPKNGSTILTKHERHFGRRFCDWNNCLMQYCQFKDYHLSVFKKITVIRHVLLLFHQISNRHSVSHWELSHVGVMRKLLLSHLQICKYLKQCVVLVSDFTS